MSELIPAFRLSNYIEGIADGWPDRDIQRAIVCSLPRRFHVLGREEQRKTLEERVPLTGTRWDALLAAMVEHVAARHDLEPPEWVHERERFLEDTWVLSPVPVIRREALMFAPAAFLRHGAVPDPKDLDSRGGETEEWAP